MLFVWRTAVIAVAVSYQLPSCSKKEKNTRRYGIDGVEKNGFAWAGGFDRGEQGPLSFNYDLKTLINQGKLDSNKYVIAPIYQFIIYH